MRNVMLLANGRDVSPTGTITAKNLAVAERIATLLDTTDTSSPYYIPFEAVYEEEATQKGITSAADLYGGIVRRAEHADKALLHVRAHAQEAPEWYEPQFAKAVEEAVLPGYTVFSPEEALLGYKHMVADGLRVRIKDPNERNARGQFVIENQKDLCNLLSELNTIQTHGVVMEANLENHSTTAVGYVALGDTSYSWYGKTWNVMSRGKQKFGGNELTLVRGTFQDLSEIAKDPEHKIAIEQTSRVFDAYALCGAMISRATFDVVQGTAPNGQFLSGVTDPSIRPSASSPAEIHAIEVLENNPETSVVTSKVIYDYGHQLTAPEPALELFASSTKTAIFVQTVAANR